MSWSITHTENSPHQGEYNAYVTKDTVNGMLTGSPAIATVDIGQTVTGTANPSTPKGTALNDPVFFKWEVAYTITFVDPCTIALVTHPQNNAVVSTYSYKDHAPAATIDWVKFTFHPSSCDALIPYPTAYAGSVERTEPTPLPITLEADDFPIQSEATTDANNNDIKRWKIETTEDSAEAFLGTYTINYYHSYSATAYASKGWAITVSIIDACEPPDSFTLPDTLTLPTKWVQFGQPALTIKLPPITTSPVRCSAELTYTATIPLAFKDVLKQDPESGDLTFSGFTLPTNLGTYKIAIQAFTAAGLEIEDASYSWDFELKEKKKSVPQELISSFGAFTNAAVQAGSAAT